jgi:class 3 adenylate cyclase
MELDVSALLRGLGERTASKFERQPAVVDKDNSFDVAKLPIDAPKWHRVSDVVAVFFDLKSSTNLERGRTPASTASIYDAGVGGVVKISHTLEANFTDIQGDGGFALFWGEGRYERALVFAITVASFSADFTEQLGSKWPDAPSTGFKVGIASGPILAKRVGVARQLDLQEPVWAGRPVNYAAKSAQQSAAEEILVTGSVWDAISGNDYLSFSCGCVDGVERSAPPTLLWAPFTIDKIPDEERFGQRLTSKWCPRHGNDFANAILSGQTKRTDVPTPERSSRTALSLGSTEIASAFNARSQSRREARDTSALGILKEDD